MKRGAWAGGVFGVLVFLLGCGMLCWTFKLASDLFMAAPTLPSTPGKPIDTGVLLSKLVELMLRIALLFTMAIVGGMIANRGIRLYAGSRHPEAEE